jgi:prepilin-type N-terminal cleavage/methylation domain-containing protein
MSGVASTRLLMKPRHPCPLPQPGERELRRAGVGQARGGVQHPAQPSGFTLLEILLALAILALVLSSLFSAYSETITATELVEASREVDQGARLTLAQMADDLKSLYQQEVKGDPKDSPYRFQGGSGESDEEAAEILNFASTAHMGFDPAGPSMSVNRIAYVLKKSGEGAQYFQLNRRERPFADFQGQGGETEMELADNVEELAVTYGDDTRTTLTEWDSASPEHAGRPPRLVQIRLKVAAGTSGGSRTFTAVVAPMAR